MRNYTIKIDRIKKVLNKVELKSKTVRIVITPKKGHMHVSIRTTGGFNKSAQTSITDNLTNDELKIAANYFYNEFSEHSCVIGLESYNYSKIFGSHWL